MVEGIWVQLSLRMWRGQEEMKMWVLQGEEALSSVCIPDGRIRRFDRMQEWQCPPGRAMLVGTGKVPDWKGLSFKDTESLIGNFRRVKGRVRKTNKGRSTRSLKRTRKPHKDNKN